MTSTEANGTRYFPSSHDGEGILYLKAPVSFFSPEEVLARAKKRLSTRPADSSIQVFDFRKHWDLVRPHLPAAEFALELGIQAYVGIRARECVESGLDPTHWLLRFDPDVAPFAYTSSDYWCMEAERKADAAIARGEFTLGDLDNVDEATAERNMDEYGRFLEKFYPQPDSPEWYQLFGACHWLVAWLVILGERIFPHLNWLPIEGDLHSFAAGVDHAGNMRIIFDILNFETMTAKQLVNFASRREKRRRRRNPLLKDTLRTRGSLTGTKL
jgi:hypothetical protein